jgi:hypothetical protein
MSSVFDKSRTECCAVPRLRCRSSERDRLVLCLGSGDSVRGSPGLEGFLRAAKSPFAFHPTSEHLVSPRIGIIIIDDN